MALDGKALNKFTSQMNGQQKQKPKEQIYANYEKETPSSPVYSNIHFPERSTSRTEPPVIKINGFKEELERRLNNSNGEMEKAPQDKPTTPPSEHKGKDSGTLSRKTYFSFKSRFKRANSVAVDINTDVPSALKITNSTFYLTDSMDGDSGFSNR